MSDEVTLQIIGPAIRLLSGCVVGGYGFVAHEEVRDNLKGRERHPADPDGAVDGFLARFDRFLNRETARRLTEARSRETTTISRTEASRRLIEEQERILQV